MRRVLGVMMVGLILGGCVPKKKFEDLQKTLADTQKSDADSKAALQKEIEARDAHAADLDKSLAEEKSKNDDLSAQVLKLTADLDSARKDSAAKQTELANAIKDKSKLKGSIDEMQRALDELARRKAESDQRVAEFKGLLDRFKTLIDAGKLKVKIVDGRMVVELATDVLFASASASLSKEGKGSIEEISRVLASIPGRKYQVEGHTDDVPMKNGSNWDLASARSLTVVNTMIGAGMPPDRISGASFGQYRPAVANDSPEHKAANRRIEIVVLPDLNSLPGFEELNKIASGSGVSN